MTQIPDRREPVSHIPTTTLMVTLYTATKFHLIVAYPLIRARPVSLQYYLLRYDTFKKGPRRFRLR